MSTTNPCDFPARRHLVSGGLLIVAVGVATGFALPLTAAPVAPVPILVPVRAVVPPSAPPIAPAPVDANAYVIRSALSIDTPLEHGDWVWDEARAPADGPVIVTVDTEAETLSVFRGGHEIGVTTITHGLSDKPTPIGVHSVIWKKAVHRSSIYDADMPYTLRLTSDGVAIHGATVDMASATNGCVGVPVPFAAKLFAVVPVGTPVIVTHGERLQVGGKVAALG